MNKKQAGRLGGIATFKKHGRDHMKEIGKCGAKVTWTLYRKVPYGLTQYAMIRNSDNTIVAITAA